MRLGPQSTLTVPEGKNPRPLISTRSPPPAGPEAGIRLICGGMAVSSCFSGANGPVAPSERFQESSTGSEDVWKTFTCQRTAWGPAVRFIGPVHGLPSIMTEDWRLGVAVGV